jgi:predicted Zn-dependent peptidase
MKKILFLFASCGALWGAGVRIPFEKYTLPNGMRVILSQDNSAPVVAIYVLYGVGARSEEKGRTGFAHLFEHMMFQGSANAPKGVHFKTVESNGGNLNGSTHPDYTDYFEVLPSNKLAVGLWLEADRMRSLAITEANLANQKEAVKEERRLSFDNQPYNTAIVDKWPQLAFGNWQSSHSLIGSYEDLNAASVEDVAKFFKTYYAPNNAILAVVGDIRKEEAKKWIGTYFSGIPAQPQPKHPDLTEPPRRGPVSDLYRDPHAQVPAVLLGYPAPERRSPDYYALVVLDALLTGGDSSRFVRNLVKGKESVVSYEAEIGWPFASSTDYKSPGLYAMSLLHHPQLTGKQVAAQVEEEIAAIQKDGPPEKELARTQTFLRAARLKNLQTSLNRAQLLAQYELLDGAPELVSTELEEFTKVTPARVRDVARKYLTPDKRVMLEIVPAPKPPSSQTKESR